jgi:hypothetical protein
MLTEKPVPLVLDVLCTGKNHARDKVLFQLQVKKEGRNSCRISSSFSRIRSKRLQSYESSSLFIAWTARRGDATGPVCAGDRPVRPGRAGDECGLRMPQTGLWSPWTRERQRRVLAAVREQAAVLGCVP